MRKGWWLIILVALKAGARTGFRGVSPEMLNGLFVLLLFGLAGAVVWTAIKRYTAPTSVPELEHPAYCGTWVDEDCSCEWRHLDGEDSYA